GSEFQAERNLSGPSTSEIDTPRSGDPAEAAIGNVKVRIAEVRPIGKVRKASLKTKAHAFQQSEPLAHADVPGKGTRTGEQADASIAEASDRRRIAARDHANTAVERERGSGGTAWAHESIAIKPRIPCRV